MRFDLTRVVSWRVVTVVLALVMCVAVPLGIHLASAAPPSAHAAVHSAMITALDNGPSDNGDAEPPKGALPDDFVIHCDNTPEAGAPVQPFDPILFNGGTAPHNHLFFGNN